MQAAGACRGRGREKRVCGDCRLCVIEKKKVKSEKHIKTDQLDRLTKHRTLSCHGPSVTVGPGHSTREYHRLCQRRSPVRQSAGPSGYPGKSGGKKKEERRKTGENGWRDKAVVHWNKCNECAGKNGRSRITIDGPCCAHVYCLMVSPGAHMANRVYLRKGEESSDVCTHAVRALCTEMATPHV